MAVVQKLELLEEPLVCVALIRMSTDDQENSPDRQRDKHAMYCERHNLVQGECYEDLGVSATKTKMTDRPGIMRMWADAGEDKFDVVWCEETSRASRDMIETLQLLDYLATLGIPFVDGNDDPHQKIDPTYKKIITAIKAGMAEGETKRLAIRVKDTMLRLASAGAYVGQQLPIGLLWDKESKQVVLDEKGAHVANRIYQLFIETGSLHKVANRMNMEGYVGKRGAPFSVSTIRRILTVPHYRGYFQWGADTFSTEFPQIIDPRTIKQTDAILLQIRRRPQRSAQAEKGIFTGLLKCHECGRWLRVQPRKSRAKSERPPTCTVSCRAAVEPPRQCGMRSSKSERLIEEALIPVLLAEVKDRARRIELGVAPKKKVQDVKHKLARLEETKRREKNLYADQLRTREEMMARLAALDAAEADLKAQLDEKPATTAATLREYGRLIEKKWPTWSKQSKRQLLQSMINYIVLDFDDLRNSKIDWRASG